MKPVKGMVLGDRYTLVRRIAVGGMGEVWVAADSALHREVAVKVLRAEYTGNEDFLARLRTEARNSAALSHPHIAQVYDYGEQERSGYLVMELVTGEPMADLLEREPVLQLHHLLPILAQTARGLHAAHVAGVVHRDVKPGNILLDRTGEVKITDFGVSLAANQVPMTATGMVMGTAQYLSPEQAIGKPATGASDLYALGIVAYESVVGHRPFTGATPVDIAVAHVNEAVPPLPPSVDRELARLIMQMLEKDPARRPPSGAFLARAFDEIMLEISDDPWGVIARIGPGATRPRSGGGHQASPRAEAAGRAGQHRAQTAGTAGAVPGASRADAPAPASGAAGSLPTVRAAAPSDEEPAPAARPSAARQAPRPPDAAGPAGGPRSYPPRSAVRADAASRSRADSRADSRRGAIPASAPAVRSPHGMIRPTTRPPRPAAQPSGAPPAPPAPPKDEPRTPTRAARREADRRASGHRTSGAGDSPRRTSTTTGRRLGGSPRGVSWPLVALAALVLLVVVVALVGCAPTTPSDASAAHGPTIVTASLRPVDASTAVDGMMLPTQGSARGPWTPMTSKDV
ncbi:serine/threonine-protein kinase [Cellulomonas sp. PhB143]|uniref:serine/threonine-protein kinase n=1 Tax=Cellulomonas sp. PhB143 TaxID=2485186 RepID=UPI000F49B6AE|nr:serine/threonine-protein kinase [Cellulomonas sp. PhB143]ROS75573.1 serine/threonine-protein kinase [Cellulomonas sp. PhB143]